MICIYEVFAIISAIVRNFLIPNPFDSLRGQTIEISGIELPVIPEIINILIEPILWRLFLLLSDCIIAEVQESL